MLSLRPLFKKLLHQVLGMHQTSLVQAPHLCYESARMLLPQVLQSLRLLEEQQGRLHSLWQSHQDCLGRLMAVRRSITQHISGTMPDGLFGRSFAINFLKVSSHLYSSHQSSFGYNSLWLQWQAGLSLSLLVAEQRCSELHRAPFLQSMIVTTG